MQLKMVSTDVKTKPKSFKVTKTIAVHKKEKLVFTLHVVVKKNVLKFKSHVMHFSSFSLKTQSYS